MTKIRQPLWPFLLKGLVRLPFGHAKRVCLPFPFRLGKGAWELIGARLVGRSLGGSYRTELVEQNKTKERVKRHDFC